MQALNCNRLLKYFRIAGRQLHTRKNVWARRRGYDAGTFHTCGRQCKWLRLGYRLVGWLVGWLVGCLTARQHKKAICANCGGKEPAQSAKDGQRDTMHITLRYSIAM